MVIRKLDVKYRTAAGESASQSFANINPTKSDYVLKTFAQMLNDLTTNTINSITKVDTEDITNATE